MIKQIQMLWKMWVNTYVFTDRKSNRFQKNFKIDYVEHKYMNIPHPSLIDLPHSGTE